MMRRKAMGIKGVCRVEVSCAYPETLLNACAMNALEIWDMDCVDSYTLRFYIYEQKSQQLKALAEKCMCEVKMETVSGGSRLFNFVKRHVVLAVTLILVLSLLGFSTLFIWDLKVYGNEKLTEGQILRALSACGVDCGCFWPGVDKELLRSEMLLRLPELAWMTVNVNSSRASVLVSERQEKPEIYEESKSADLIAAKTGIIKRISALNGKVMAEEGSSVIEGETLISGLVDSITAQPRQVRSQGEVIAETWHESHAVAPTVEKGKTQHKRPRTRIAVKFGQKRLNFYLGGRKTVDGYDKIIDNYIIGIEGVFALPITVIAERIIPYETQERELASAQAMSQRLYKRLEESVDGEILSFSLTEGSRDGLSFVSLRAACLEDIAQLKEHVEIDDKMP